VAKVPGDVERWSRLHHVAHLSPGWLAVDENVEPGIVGCCSVAQAVLCVELEVVHCDGGCQLLKLAPARDVMHLP
jgi:hypothetical protein